METVKLQAQEATAKSFAPFGQVVTVIEDQQVFGPEDAQLDLSQGTPRFYLMRIPGGTLDVRQITYHSKVTQCLAASGDDTWYMVVAAPEVEPFPRQEDLMAFRIPPKTIVKLSRGTWHAGPLFRNSDSLMFYNLELSDTNQVDHTTHVFKEQGISVVIENEKDA